MAKVVFSLTTAQIKALRYIAANGRTEYNDYGASENLVRRGWAASGKNYRQATLTKKGRAVLAMVDALGLEAPVAGG